jgi:hypothetical protein
MSRFPEVQRIERAIKSKEEHQLTWAISYCESRLAIDTDPRQVQEWNTLLDRVRTALAATRGGK